MVDEDESWAGFGAETLNRVPFDIAFETDDEICSDKKFGA
jgi:hypothetical protein